ncbi:MAG: DUF4388 domain-containing protein [Deltaproteobacteria bacterium]|nr:DUF4388 domain-containing protein [Deltaproteobacteria bacterium]
MAETKYILLALKNDEDTSSITKGLKENALEHVVTNDGAKTMEEVIKRAPGVIICDVNIAGVTADRLLQMVKSNPKTASVPFVFIADKQTDVKGYRPGTDTILVRPFHWGELYGVVKQGMFIASGADAAGHIRGDLAQMSLVDLLQVLHFNQKEGVLTIQGDKHVGKIYMKGGQVFNATVAEAEKEKALYRFFMWPKGAFEFVPEPVNVPQKIDVPTGNLLMEGARLFDEFERDKDKFPRDNSLIKVNVDTATLPKGLKPAISEIIFLTKYYSTVKELVDHCSFPDYDAYTTIRNLIQRNILSEVKDTGGPDTDKLSIVTPAQAVRIKEQVIGKWGENLNVNFGRVFVASPSPALAKDFVAACSKLPDFRSPLDLKGGSKIEDFILGEIGAIRVYGDLDIAFYSVPCNLAMVPLMITFYPNLIGAIILMDENTATFGDMNKFKERIVTNRRVPVLNVAVANSDISAEQTANFKRLAAMKPSDELNVLKGGTDQKESIIKVLKAFMSHISATDFASSGGA